MEKGLTKFEGLLQETKGKYCFGEEVTLADVVLVPFVYNARKNGVQIESKFSGISSVLITLEEIPEFREAHAES